MDNLISNSLKLLLVRYPLFASEVASAKIEYRNDLKYHTAATDGKNIYIDPNYFARLTQDERDFTLAHEFMHKKFNHVSRLKDKDGNMRDKDIYNIAADAVINANLKRDGFKIKEGSVDRPEALKYSVEEFYEILKKEKEEKNKDNNNFEKNNKVKSDNNDYNPDYDNNTHYDNDNAENKESSNSEFKSDDHSMWDKALENYEKSIENEEPKKQSANPQKEEIKETEVFSQNRIKRNYLAQEKLKNMRENMYRKLSNESKSDSIQFNGVGDANDSVPWEVLVHREVDKNESIWTQRRSVLENNYAYRLEENEIDEDAISEVMIDVSGSVDLDLVKAFLRTLKSLLKHSKLKVGCFNKKFWGMVEIKSISDIDNFVIPEGARGSSARTEDWDLAVRSFTKKSEINKFVFTDGQPGPGNMPKEDLKNEEVIWIVYGNKDFKPCCGKVIQLSDKEINKLSNLEDEFTVKR